MVWNQHICSHRDLYVLSCKMVVFYVIYRYAEVPVAHKSYAVFCLLLFKTCATCEHQISAIFLYMQHEYVEPSLSRFIE